MKILTVLDSYPPDLNGGAYFTQRLVNGLVGLGHRVMVVCPSLTNRTQRYESEGVSFCRVRSWPALVYPNMRIAWPLLTFGVVRRAVDQFQPDVIHLQGRFFLGSQVATVGQARGIPMLATNHFMPENFFHHSRLPNLARPAFDRWAWRWVRDMFVKADAYSTPTKTAADLLRRLGLPHPVQPISCGVDTSVFKPRPRDPELFRAFGVPNRKTLLYAGRLDKEKNLGTAIRTLELASKHADCQLVLTGRGPERNALQTLVGKLGLSDRVLFLGCVEEDAYPRIFSMADCFVHAGTAELQSIVTLEAVASGLPVVAARAMALPELVQHGKNGFLFEAGDAEDAARHVVTLLTDDAQNAAMRRASRCLSLGHRIERTVELYEQLYKRLAA